MILWYVTLLVTVCSCILDRAKDVETFPDKRETENQFGSLNRRLIKRTPSMNVIDESETTQVRISFAIGCIRNRCLTQELCQCEQ